MTIRYWLTGERAQAPQRHQGVALDLRLRLSKTKWRLVWGWAKLPTGVALEMPDDLAVRITGRSSAFLRGLIVHDGLVESEFNGHELMVLVYAPWPRLLRHGERIAQMWALNVDRAIFQLADGPAKRSASKDGFGSTGR